jgi:hypothetical protein
MRKYYGEVATEENWEKYHDIITVEASSVQNAFKKIMGKMRKDQDIYQICRDFSDCELPQPVYDYFNGFHFAGSEATAETWEDHWN